MKKGLTMLPILLSMMTGQALAASDAPTVKDVTLSVDTVFVFTAFVLVFFMQAGFAMLEAGGTRMKNAAHIAGKNVLSFAIASIVFWAVGFAITFGAGNGWMGTSGWFLRVADDQVDTVFSSLAYTQVPLTLKFLIALAYAGVSLAVFWGGIAERAKLAVYIVFGIVFIGFIYPVIGHWVWGGGWLSKLGMQDFAGSTVVHLTGATAALAGSLLLGPRVGRYNKDGTPNPMPGHNTVYSVLGVLILWFGWFGFNPGSAMAANASLFTYVAMTTNLGAAGGAVGGLIAAWLIIRKADISMMLNGTLGALVAITAGTAFVAPWAAVVIGLVGGVTSVLAMLFLERVARVDDPVSTIAVHGAAGIWGTLATGLFATPELVKQVGVGSPGLFYGGGWNQLWVQFVGVAASFAFVFVVSFIVLYIMKVTIGLRISREEEIIGLDIAEHGSSGYPEQLPHGGDYYRGAQPEFTPSRSV